MPVGIVPGGNFSYVFAPENGTMFGLFAYNSNAGGTMEVDLNLQVAEKVKERRRRFLEAGFKEEHVDVLSLAYIDGMKEGTRCCINFAARDHYTRKDLVDTLNQLSLSITKCGNALHSVMKSQESKGE